jgi:tetratricopeptide (TPR) repeat protein
MWLSYFFYLNCTVKVNRKLYGRYGPSRKKWSKLENLCRTGLVVPAFASILIAITGNTQAVEAGEKKWGVVLHHPLSDSIISHSFHYAKGREKELNMEVFLPPKAKKSDRYPAVLFLTEMNKDRSWEIYRSWPRLLATYGLAAILADIEYDQYTESVTKLIGAVTANGADYSIDTSSLGVYIPSHVPPDVIYHLIREKHFSNVKTVVLVCSGPSLLGPFRKDLPVLYIGEDQLNFPETYYSGLWNEVQKSKAPWTIRFASNMPLFFDAFADNEEAKRIVREIIFFLKNQLEHLPATFLPAADREMLVPLYRADYQKAAILFKDWLQQYPDDQYANSKYAMMMFMQGNYSEAEKAYRKVKDPEALHRIDFAKTLFALNEPAEAEEQIEIALRSGKVRRNPYAGLGSFLYSLGKISEGVSYFEKAVQANPQPSHYYSLAIGYVKLNKINAAFEALNNAVERGLNSGQFLQDDAFKALHHDKRWQELMKKWSKKTPTESKNW